MIKLNNFESQKYNHALVHTVLLIILFRIKDTHEKMYIITQYYCT